MEQPQTKKKPMEAFKSLLRRKKKSSSSSSIPISATPEPRINSYNNINNNNHSVASSSSLFRHTHHHFHNNQQLTELKHVFNKFDANGDGKICSTELGSIMTSLGQKVSDDELIRMIKEVDSDGDGFISLEEFVELNTNGVDPDEVMVNLREAFSVYDIDGNGRVTAEELHRVLSSLGDECSVSDCRRMISGVDGDGDGMIDFDEFKEMMMAGDRRSGVIVREG